LNSEFLNSNPTSEQEKENLKKLIDDIWDYRNKKLSLKEMNEKGYDSDSVLRFMIYILQYTI
jgi:hypothetical protein